MTVSTQNKTITTAKYMIESDNDRDDNDRKCAR